MRLNTYGVPLKKLIQWMVEKKFPDGVNFWVDLGCGDGSFISSLNIPIKKGVGVDVIRNAFCLPKNFKYKKENVFSWVKENSNRNNRFQVLSMFELVEHLEKDKAWELIDVSQKVAPLVILSTPKGFLKQDIETNPEHKNNPYQWHRSGFKPDELEKEDFLVLILRNVHTRKFGVFDAMIAIKDIESKNNYTSLINFIRKKSFLYNLHPLHFFRTARQFIKSYIYE